MKSGLNRQQSLAVTTPGNLLLIAVPGSGKTTVLTQRAYHLLEKYRQQRVIAVTFTREAANEFKARVNRLGPLAEKGVNVGTFHALAYVQLRNTNLTQKLISEATRMNIIRNVWQHAGPGLEFKEVSDAIEFHKSQLEPDSKGADTIEFYNAYQEALRRSNAIDFQDLLIMAVKGMQAGRIAPLTGDSLLVDEFQDTDSVQYEWIRAHGKNMDVTVVGDDDQTIFSWRHAMGYQGMCQFEQEFEAQRIHLSLNYRCRPEILTVADKLIQHNRTRSRKELNANKSRGGTVQAYCYETFLDEGLMVAKTAKRDPDNTAVLSRTNRRLDLIEQVFTSASIPYYRIGGKRLWERRHVGVLLELLGTIHDKSNLGIEHALAFTGFGETEIKSMYRATGENLNKMFAPDFNHSQITMDSRQEKIFTSFKEAFAGWRTQYTKNYIDLLIYSASEWLAKRVKSKPQKEDIEIAGASLAQMRGSLIIRLNRVKTLTKKKDQEGTALMTLHGAKGLEFKQVWMIGVEERVLPHEDGEMEEERRLCYVGVTRAMDHLYLSAVNVTNPASRFMDEMGLKPEKIPTQVDEPQEPDLEPAMGTA